MSDQNNQTSTNNQESSTIKGFIDQVTVTKGAARFSRGNAKYGLHTPSINSHHTDGPVIAPSINFHHIDGPVLVKATGEMHWLTWKERFLCWIGFEDAESLNDKHTH